MRPVEQIYARLKQAVGPNPLDDPSADPTDEATYRYGDLLKAKADQLSQCELVTIWRDMSQTPFPEAGDGYRFFRSYFEFGKDSYIDADGRHVRTLHAVRALDFICVLVEHEPNDEIVALVGGLPSLLTQLVHYHSRELVERCEARADLGRLRWLLGSVKPFMLPWIVVNDTIRENLLAFSDARSFDAWRARNYAQHRLSGTTMSPTDYASGFIEKTHRTPVELTRDDLKHLISEWERDRLQDDKAALLQGVIEIERLDKRDALRAYLAAGPLENLISSEDPQIIAGIEAEASRNQGFKDLLGGVWLYSVSPEVADRIEAARDGMRW